MMKNRHKALTLWARARDYECQRSIAEARHRNENRWAEYAKNDTISKNVIDSSQSSNLRLISQHR